MMTTALRPRCGRPCTRRPVRAKRRFLAFGVACAAAVLLLSGCSGPTAAGCGGGVASGMLLAGVSAAAANDKDPSIDVGTAILGGALFGIVSGCTGAAIAESITASNGQSRPAAESLPTPAVLYTPTPQTPRVPHAPGTITRQIDLDGVHTLWVARPERYGSKVGLRFERYRELPSGGDCKTLDMIIDGRSHRYDLAAKTEQEHGRTLETAQATIDIAVVKEMRAATAVEFQLCELRRPLTHPAARALFRFVDEYDALARTPTASPRIEDAAPPLASDAEPQSVESAAPAPESNLPTPAPTVAPTP
jgi:hypothetical protein